MRILLRDTNNVTNNVTNHPHIIANKYKQLYT